MQMGICIWNVGTWIRFAWWRIGEEIIVSGIGPSLRWTINYQRWSIWLGVRKGSNYSICDMRFPHCIGNTKPRQIRDNNVNIT